MENKPYNPLHVIIMELAPYWDDINNLYMASVMSVLDTLDNVIHNTCVAYALDTTEPGDGLTYIDAYLYNPFECDVKSFEVEEAATDFIDYIYQGLVAFNKFILANNYIGALVDVSYNRIDKSVNFIYGGESNANRHG
ncbi:hypothetical protein ABN214_15315 [Proteus terrae]|uniref:hypothetical protein n=1 Tax=Proteus terrae TaxID=1574161 RepID=UPI0032DAE475